MGSVQAQSSVITRWRAARRLYPIYYALALQFGLRMPPCRDLDEVDVHSEPDLLDQAEQWFAELDQQLQVHQFRQLLHGTGISVSEEKLHALIDRCLGKTDRSDADRDKLDFLLVQYFAVCAPPSLQDREVTFEDVAEVLRPVLGDVSAEIPDWARPLEQWVAALREFTMLAQLEQSGIVQQGRQLKSSARHLYFAPTALVAFTRFSYLLRRTFFFLINSDLKAIDAALDVLENRGCDIDCTPIQLPLGTTVGDLRRYCENFKKPAVPEYTADTSTARLAQVRQFLAAQVAASDGNMDAAWKELEERFQRIEQEFAELRQVTAALLAGRNRPGAAARQEATPAMARPEAAAPTPAPEPIRPAAEPPQTVPQRPPAAAPNLSATIEEIRRRLNAGARRGISSLAIAGTALLLTAEEVEAFVRPSDSAANDLQRSLAARALLVHAMEMQKRTGQCVGLEGLMEFCRTEAANIQMHSAQARDANQAQQAAVLSASANQLALLLRQAEAVAKQAPAAASA